MSFKAVLIFLTVPLILAACQAGESITSSASGGGRSIEKYSLIDDCWNSNNGDIKVGIVAYVSEDASGVFLTSPQCRLTDDVYDKFPILDFRFRPRSIVLNGRALSPKIVRNFDSFNVLPEWPDQIIAAEVKLKFPHGGAFSEGNLPEVEIVKSQNLPRELFGRFLSTPADRATLIEHYLEGSAIGVFDDNGYRDGDRN